MRKEDSSRRQWIRRCCSSHWKKRVTSLTRKNRRDSSERLKRLNQSTADQKLKTDGQWASPAKPVRAGRFSAPRHVVLVKQTKWDNKSFHLSQCCGGVLHDPQVMTLQFCCKTAMPGRRKETKGDKKETKTDTDAKLQCQADGRRQEGDKKVINTDTNTKRPRQADTRRQKETRRRQKQTRTRNGDARHEREGGARRRETRDASPKWRPELKRAHEADGRIQEGDEKSESHET